MVFAALQTNQNKSQKKEPERQRQPRPHRDEVVKLKPFEKQQPSHALLVHRCRL